MCRTINSDKINVNMRHPMGWTPLLVAAVNGRLEIVKILLKAGADPNMSDEFSNINRMARDMKLHSLESKSSPI